ncbi:MAG: DNA polymerase III subunit delta [Rickettsiaceae bacterium]|nr:MAG: DNA polymerase III subunit delta [Rickettsiaceae bacterium]
MKLYYSQINELIKKIKSNDIKSILLYGPDKGYIGEACITMIKELNLIPTTIEYLEFTPKQLTAMANRLNFFSDKELIKIINVPVSLNAEIKSLLDNDHHNIMVFIADELSPTSTIRKYFEKSANSASIACYCDEEREIAKIIINKCQAKGKTISTEAVDFLKVNLKGDYNIINTEMDKLIIYTTDRSHINFQDVSCVISTTINANYDDLCIYFSQKNLEFFLKETEKLRQQSINEVSIIRSLLKYYINMYIVLTKEEEGQDVDLAIKSLSPAIFFKYIKDFRITVSRNNIREVINVINILNQAELDFKSNSHNFDLYQSTYYRAHNGIQPLYS